MNKVVVAFNKGYRVDKNGVLYGVRGKPLSTDYFVDGYQQFTIWTGTKKKQIRAHRLQAYQKFGQEMFQDGVMVRHLNGDKLDNSWDNIAIGTMSDNVMDIPANIRHTRAVERGRTCCSTLTVGDVQEMRRLREEENWTYAELMAKFGIANSTVAHIIRNETWCDI